MQESYEFQYDCQHDWSDPGQDPEVEHTVIDISVSLEPGPARKYAIDYYVHDTPGYDWDNLGYDMFEQVEGKMLSELAADGVTESMLIYP